MRNVSCIENGGGAVAGGVRGGEGVEGEVGTGCTALTGSTVLEHVPRSATRVPYFLDTV